MISHAIVETDRADRYAKQLVSHLGRKCQVEEIDGGSKVIFAMPDRPRAQGEVLVIPVAGKEESQLVLVAESDDVQGHGMAEHVLGDHLVRFGVKDSLQVEWVEGPLEG